MGRAPCTGGASRPHGPGHETGPGALSGDRWPRAQLDRRPVQFLYRDGDDFHFMENETYDQFSIRAEQLEDAVHYLKDGMTVDRTSYQG